MATESKGERLDRELEEFLQGLRVLLPGVQVLFAFLLTVPFSQRFGELTDAERALFVTALACAAVAAALLIAPSAFHRVLFRDRDKEWLIVTVQPSGFAGSVLPRRRHELALFLVVEVVYGFDVAAGTRGGLGVLFIGLWFVVPLVRRARN